MKKKKTTWQRIVKAIPSIEKKSEEAEKALKNLKKLKEDAPINNAGGGAIAGLGTGPQPEPGIKKGKFAGNTTFMFRRQKYAEFQARSKKDHKWWKNYLGEDDHIVNEIRAFAKKYPHKPIIFEDEDTGNMFYARYGKKEEEITMITAAMIKQIAPNAKDEIVTPMVAYFNMYAEKYAINTYWRIVHFLAQAAHESAGFRTLEEFASGQAYEGRKDLGNIHEGDGRRYKGRGIFQLTGRTNYRNMGNRLGIDLENDPELAETPRISVLTAMEYWNSRGLSGFADRDDVDIITKKINGGDNGLADRKNYLKKAMAVIPHNIKITSDTVTPNIVAPPVVEGITPANRNSRGENVRKIQKLLNRHGANLKEDGQFGRQTEIAVKAFQKSRALLITGNVDVNTLKALTG